MKRLLLIPIALMSILISACGAGQTPKTVPTANSSPSSQSAAPVSTIQSPTIGNQGSLQPTSANSSYPAPQQAVESTANDSIYPGPNSSVPTSGISTAATSAPWSVPTVIPGKAMVTGQMLTPGPGGKPYTGNLYLATAIYDKQHPAFPPMLRLSETDSPKAVVNTDGHFYITNVTPGTYGLMVYSFAGTYFITDSSGDQMLVTLKAGDIKDVGILSIK